MVIRILSVIGIVLTVAFIAWIFIAALSNGRIDIDEFTPPAFFYGIYMLALSVVGTVLGGKRKPI
jgi:ABC-type thiamin/hydroxymethylpyrimidine transport system permease subunit